MSTNVLKKDWRKTFLGLDDSKDDDNFIVKHVIKRDGQLEIYDRTRIYDAIAKVRRSII